MLTRLHEWNDVKEANAAVSFGDSRLPLRPKPKHFSFLGDELHQALGPDSPLASSVETLSGDANGAPVGGSSGGRLMGCPRDPGDWAWAARSTAGW